MNNKNLRSANKNKKDEFYTQYEDIEKEIVHYKECLKDKIIYCNCDDYRTSNFYKYFKNNFKELNLKLLYTSCYIEGKNGVGAIYNGIGEKEIILKGDGDFRSEECVNTLKKCDIVVTNPPFSLFREFIDISNKYNKDFIVIGNINSITYKNVSLLIKANKFFCGYGFKGDEGFFMSPYENMANRKSKPGTIRINGVTWFTSFNIRQNIFLEATKEYSQKEYSKYDNYNAINVDKVRDIPKDYYEPMGVPITFLKKYNPKQFKIIKFRKGEDGKDLRVNGVDKYFRIIIQRIKED